MNLPGFLAFIRHFLLSKFVLYRFFSNFHTASLVCLAECLALLCQIFASIMQAALLALKNLLIVVHANCLRNFRLPEWKCRTSSMLYFSITSRSMPKPQAKPVYLFGSMLPSRKTFGWIMQQPPSSIQPV